MFSLLGLDETRIAKLRETHRVYVPPDGRMNVAGISEANVDLRRRQPCRPAGLKPLADKVDTEQEIIGTFMLSLNRYQWTVLVAAWLGWGFDVFDAFLFNYVAPNCVPALLGLEIGSPEAKQATLYWTGLLTSLLLLGWAAGGVLFGMVADRIGRTRTLLLTMLMYALGTAACAAAPEHLGAGFFPADREPRHRR